LLVPGIFLDKVLVDPVARRLPLDGRVLPGQVVADLFPGRLQGDLLAVLGGLAPGGNGPGGILAVTGGGDAGLGELGPARGGAQPGGQENQGDQAREPCQTHWRAPPSGRSVRRSATAAAWPGRRAAPPRG